jgi:hypothetical protein
VSRAEIQRAYRQRLRNGAVAARVDIGEDVLTAMAYRGWTKADREIPDADMRRHIARALSEWARETCPFV